MKHLKWYLAGVLFCPMVGPSFASSDRFVTNVVNSRMGDTPIESPTSFGNNLEISAGTAKDSASFQITPRLGNNNFILSFSTPLNKDAEEATIKSLDAFANSSKVKINYQWVNFRSNYTDDQLIDNARRLIEVCEDQPQAFQVAEREDCSAENRIDDLVANFDDTLASDDTLRELTNFWTSALNQPIHLFGVTATVSSEELEYLEATSNKLITANEHPTGAGAYYTYVQPDSFMISVEYEYKRGFESQDEITRCNNVQDATFLLCATGSNGMPKRQYTRNIALSLRKPINLGGLALAISPKIAHDIGEHTTAFSLPIYFFQDNDNSLTGGVRADWEHGTDWEFGIFIRNKFEIF